MMQGCASLVTNRQRRAGRVVSAVPILFLLLDGGMKLFKPSFVVQATTQLGYPESTIVGIGTVLVLSVLLHLLPRTSFLGALLLTAYLGGAVASKVRVGAPLFDFAFASIVAALLWSGFWLRDGGVRALLPIRRVARATAMAKFVTIGYGDRNGYERTDPGIRNAAHAHDARLRDAGTLMGVAGIPVQVRNSDAKQIETAPGPFMTSALPVAGFAVIEAATLADAVKLVSQTPCAVAHGV